MLTPFSRQRLLAALLFLGLALGAHRLGWAEQSDHPLASVAPAAKPGKLGVSETLRGTLGYTRWPLETGPLRLCLIGRSAHGERLLKEGIPDLEQRSIVVQKVANPSDDIVAQCDALYIGVLDDVTWRRIFTKILGHPILTVSERVSDCKGGSMVCLDIDENLNVQFEVNLDSVARSRVRINPQVLKLGRRSSKATP